MNTSTDQTRVRPTVTHVLCAITSAACLCVGMIMTGVMFVREPGTLTPIFMAIMGVAMMIVAYYSAWIAGRASEAKATYRESSRGGSDRDPRDGQEPDEPVLA